MGFGRFYVSLKRLSGELDAAIEENGADFTLPPAAVDTGSDGLPEPNLVWMLGSRFKAAHDYATRLDTYNSHQRAGTALIEFDVEFGGIVKRPLRAKSVRKHCDHLFIALQDDLATREFVYVPPTKADYLRHKHPFGEHVSARFPSTDSEIVSAARDNIIKDTEEVRDTFTCH